MTTYRYHILGFMLGSYMVVICRSYEVFFGLKGRSEGNQAVFNDETGVIITCNVTCLVNASIQIDIVSDRAARPITTLKENNQHGHFLDLPLPGRLSFESKFRCLVKYNDPITGYEVSKEVFWFPHIIHETDPVYCRRNGTVSQPYKIGDILLLECFCNLTIATSCRWTSVTNSTRTEFNYGSVEKGENLTVYRLIVGPITPTDESTFYECLPFSYSSISRSCAINARKRSNADYVFNPTSSSDCDTATEISTKGSPHLSTNAGINSGEGPSFKRETIIFIGIASFIVIAILISVVSAVILIRNSKRKAKHETEDHGNDYYATIDDQNQGKGGLTDTIDQCGASRFKSDKAEHSSSLGRNENSNIDASGKDNYGYSVVNEKGLPYSTWDKSQCHYDNDIVPNWVGTEAETDFSDVYTKVQK